MLIASTLRDQPDLLRARLGWRIASNPPTVIVPVEGVTMPQMMLISVVLPAPFGPSSAKISPLLMSRSTAWSAWTPEA